MLWVKASEVVANDYNPNVMAAGEKNCCSTHCGRTALPSPSLYLKRKGSTGRGWFSPAVAGQTRVRSRKTPERLVARHLYQSRTKGKAERIASTIRHNRARGKHQIASMSDIVRDLARLGWADERIGKELGMDRDEVLRLKQISGLTELFEEEDFSPARTVR